MAYQSEREKFIKSSEYPTLTEHQTRRENRNIILYWISLFKQYFSKSGPEIGGFPKGDSQLKQQEKHDAVYSELMLSYDLLTVKRAERLLKKRKRERNIEKNENVLITQEKSITLPKPKDELTNTDYNIPPRDFKKRPLNPYITQHEINSGIPAIEDFSQDLPLLKLKHFEEGKNEYDEITDILNEEYNVSDSDDVYYKSDFNSRHTIDNFGLSLIPEAIIIKSSSEIRSIHSKSNISNIKSPNAKLPLPPTGSATNSIELNPQPRKLAKTLENLQSNSAKPRSELKQRQSQHSGSSGGKSLKQLPNLRKSTGSDDIQSKKSKSSYSSSLESPNANSLSSKARNRRFIAHTQPTVVPLTQMKDTSVNSKYTTSFVESDVINISDFDEFFTSDEEHSIKFQRRQVPQRRNTNEISIPSRSSKRSVDIPASPSYNAKIPHLINLIPNPAESNSDAVSLQS